MRPAMKNTRFVLHLCDQPAGGEIGDARGAAAVKLLGDAEAAFRGRDVGFDERIAAAIGRECARARDVLECG